MQKPCPRLCAVSKMQALRVLVSRKEVLFLSESKFHLCPVNSLFTAKRSSAFQPIISCFFPRAFYSSEQFPSGEEDDPAARVWALQYPEQIVTNSESGESADEGDVREGKILQKGKLDVIKKVEDSGEVVVKAEDLWKRRPNGWPSRAGGRFGGKAAKERAKNFWFCKECGAEHGQWWGTCPSCRTVGSVKQSVEEKISKLRGKLTFSGDLSPAMVPQSLADVNKGKNQSDWRMPLCGQFGTEVARVLGGGLVPGSLVLVGGDPGVGKSTLLLQVAAIFAQEHGCRGPARVLYVSGEESVEQIGNRADRMSITTADLFLYSSTDVEDILDRVHDLSPGVLIVDSIQTVYLRGSTGSAGSITQVKECTFKLLQFAKETNIPVLLIGHVTKTGDMAGPRMLEHMVDVVLYMEGERYSSYRLLRSVKNRFGSTDELGLLEMKESGLQAVSNPSEMFLSDNYFDSEILTGVALAVVIDGSRTFVIEIQALCIYGSSISRVVNGIKESRAHMIISVLMKQAGLKLQDNSIFLNVVSGFKLRETAGDLAIAAAICSSFLEFPIPHDATFIGEIGLGGELRMVPKIDKRVSAAAQLGFKRCVVPKAAENILSSLGLDITIIGCRTFKDVINTVFTTG